MLKIRPVSWSIVNFTVSNPEIESLLSLKEDIWQFLTNSISVTSSDFKQEDNTNAKHKFVAYKGTKVETFFAFTLIPANIYNILVDYMSLKIHSYDFSNSSL